MFHLHLEFVWTCIVFETSFCVCVGRVVLGIIFCVCVARIVFGIMLTWSPRPAKVGPTLSTGCPGKPGNSNFKVNLHKGNQK